MLRVLFAGTPDFAVPSLNALTDDADISVECVLTQPDRKSGRGQITSESAVKKFAISAGLSIRQPETLKDLSEVQWIKAQNFDAIIIVAYGQILGSGVLQSARLGCVNLHASMLPRWRGAAPLQRAIEAGDTETGVTIMLMDEGLDTGAVLATTTQKINDLTTASSLHDALAISGGSLLVNTLKLLNAQLITPRQQPDGGATYAAKVSTADGAIQWHRPLEVVLRQIHAFNAIPGAYTFANSKRIKIFKVCRANTELAKYPGMLWQMVDRRVIASTGTGNLEILECQLPGSKRMDISQIASHQAAPWARLVKLSETAT